MVVGAAAGFAILAVLSFVPTLVAAGAGYELMQRWRASRRVSALARQRVDDVNALLALAAELRSGLAPGEALRTVGAASSTGSVIGGRMLAAAAAESLGGDPARMLMDAAEPGSATAALAAAWTVSRRTGARLAAPVARIAGGALADLRVRREAEAALAGARSSAQLLAILPVAGIGLGVVSGTGSVHVLLATGIGQACLAVGVALDLAGLRWLDRLAADGSA